MNMLIFIYNLTEILTSEYETLEKDEDILSNYTQRHFIRELEESSQSGSLTKDITEINPKNGNKKSFSAYSEIAGRETESFKRKREEEEVIDKRKCSTMKEIFRLKKIESQSKVFMWETEEHFFLSGRGRLFRQGTFIEVINSVTIYETKKLKQFNSLLMKNITLWALAFEKEHEHISIKENLEISDIEDIMKKFKLEELKYENYYNLKLDYETKYQYERDSTFLFLKKETRVFIEKNSLVSTDNIINHLLYEIRQLDCDISEIRSLVLTIFIFYTVDNLAIINSLRVLICRSFILVRTFNSVDADKKKKATSLVYYHLIKIFYHFIYHEENRNYYLIIKAIKSLKNDIKKNKGFKTPFRESELLIYQIMGLSVYFFEMTFIKPSKLLLKGNEEFKGFFEAINRLYEIGDVLVSNNIRKIDYLDQQD
ncbi:hypothetical protein NGRA_1397 [Nosema granulosis]|uniref:Uncharacterized protein n=1 Tax=Nosema granulosis TaxID=83296 RepID=A0A9P6GZ14_9MICR|nr:hypothetical protein NGRA_1397 [Nosema granulosis]